MQLLKLENAPYLLRWRFDFHGKAAVFGMWSNPFNTAWNQNREGLARASIEVKSNKTSLTQTAVECDGHDFRNFQWLVLSRVNPSFRGSVTPRAEHVGLKILTTNEEISVLIDGQCARRKLTEEEKGIQFATFGK
jgi:hypothetical protein